jgi:hypothetical protein
MIGIDLNLLKALSFLMGKAENMTRTLSEPLYT